MAKYTKLDAEAKRALNVMCQTMGYNFPLGDWIAKVDGLLSKLDSDSGVADTDYEDSLKND